MGSRRRARELALQTLFAMEFSPGSGEQAIADTHARGREPRSNDPELAQLILATPPMLAFHDTLVRGVLANRDALDELIGRSSTNWKVPRMALVDRNVLRIAAFELQFLTDIPPKVSLNEAIEVGKRYGSAESGAFINGILDRIASIDR